MYLSSVTRNARSNEPRPGLSDQMKKSDVANHSGGLATEDGRTVYGLDAEVYEKVSLNGNI